MHHNPFGVGGRGFTKACASSNCIGTLSCNSFIAETVLQPFAQPAISTCDIACLLFNSRGLSHSRRNALPLSAGA